MTLRWRTRRGEARQRRGRQGALPFLARSRRRERAFKAAIVAGTAALLAAMLAASPTGRAIVFDLWHRARWGTTRALFGLGPPRETVEADRARWRRIGETATRARLAEVAARSGPRVERMLEAARMSPKTAVVRWGNYNQTLVLSADVFEPDDQGLSYRFRPNVRSIWFIGLSLDAGLCQFQVLDAPGPRAACAEAGGKLVPQSVQTTNSWGCRGPEPDRNAELRGIVLGDSVMQGPLVGDDQTAPAQLERALARKTQRRVSVLNTGTIGYSPEQYYYALIQYLDRMAPHFVVVSLCGNDFGAWNDPEGWEEAHYWLEKIAQLCRTREIVYLVVPWPGEQSLIGLRDDSQYPGMVSRFMKVAGTRYYYPIEEFTTEDLRLRAEHLKKGEPLAMSKLYNRHLLGDNHLSPAGCALWGDLVAERLHLVFIWSKKLPAAARESAVGSRQRAVGRGQ